MPSEDVSSWALSVPPREARRESPSLGDFGQRGSRRYFCGCAPEPWGPGAQGNLEAHRPHDPRNRDAVLFEDEILLVSVNAPHELRQIHARFGYWKMMYHNIHID